MRDFDKNFGARLIILGVTKVSTQIGYGFFYFMKIISQNVCIMRHKIRNCGEYAVRTIFTVEKLHSSTPKQKYFAI